jgi:glutamate mutase epsilon subunit
MTTFDEAVARNAIARVVVAGLFTVWRGGRIAQNVPFRSAVSKSAY